MNLPANPFIPGAGNYRVWEHLKKHGAVTTHELNRKLKVNTARLRSDIRPILKSHEMDYTIDPIPGDPSNWLYRVLSPFEALLLKKNKEEKEGNHASFYQST